jgi:N6-adenosine-specific RNA methylase IME4
MSSSILFQNDDKTKTLIDIPRSIEEAQVLSNDTPHRKLLSCKPLEKAFLATEPKSAKAVAALQPESLDSLLTQKHVQFALQELRSGYDGAWCLSREVLEDKPPRAERKRKASAELVKGSSVEREPGHEDLVGERNQESAHQAFLHNSTHSETRVSSCFIPPKSTYLHGSLSSTLPTFLTYAPKFNLVMLDPPWPNRSARHKSSYKLSYDTASIASLLSLIPFPAHLANDAIVGVWVTNKEKFREMILGEGGLFDLWGVAFVEEWIWGKVTSQGKPILPIDGTWRKPYEILLVGRKRGHNERPTEVKKRIIFGVPDLHSRKPSLRGLCEDVFGLQRGKYDSLEVFARHLTAGWWGWGDDCLKFQGQEWWVERKEREPHEQEVLS